MSDDQAARNILVVDDKPEVEPMFRQRMRREIRAGRVLRRCRCWKQIRMCDWLSPILICRK